MDNKISRFNKHHQLLLTVIRAAREIKALDYDKDANMVVETRVVHNLWKALKNHDEFVETETEKMCDDLMF